MTRRLASTAFVVNEEEEIVGVQDVNDGEEHLFVYQNDLLEVKSIIHVAVNKNGSAITKGQVAYISGAQGQRIATGLANASAESTSSKTFGIAYEDIAKNQSGRFVTEGMLEGIDTHLFAEGDLIWLSTTSGQITNVRPTAPNHGVFLGICVNSNANVGSIFVKVQNGLELDELHNVLITDPQNGDILKYNSSTKVWYNTQP